MYKGIIRFFQFMMVIGAFSIAASAQTTTGTVQITGNVSKYVELSSGGAATLANDIGGSITTQGTANSPLGVVLSLGEVGPSNTASFVTATVPLRIRSNANYSLAMSATISSAGTTDSKIGLSDIGFGLGTTVRNGVGVHTTGADVNSTAGDPTAALSGINVTTGRFEFLAPKSNLGNFATSQAILTGDRVMNAVPAGNTNGMNVPAIFAIKPQFYEPGTTTATVTFTVTAP
jgi:hypothetical protein